MKSLIKKVMMGLMIILLGISSFFIANQEIAGAGIPSFNPECDYRTELNGWYTTFNDNNNTLLCLFDAQTLFIKVGVGVDEESKELFKRGHVDVFMEAIGFEQSRQLMFGGGVEVVFDYYRPFYMDDGVTCPLFDEIIFISNAATESFSDNVFDTNDYLLTKDEVLCGKWQTLRVSVKQFGNDWSEQDTNKFSSASRGIGSVSFEFSNVYLRNIRIVDYNGVEQVVWNGTKQ